MTREEATAKLMEATDSACTARWMEDFIDSAVALGMVKLDEPKTITGRIADAMAHITDQSPPGAVRLAFENAGLKIVEK